VTGVRGGALPICFFFFFFRRRVYYPAAWKETKKGNVIEPQLINTKSKTQGVYQARRNRQAWFAVFSLYVNNGTKFGDQQRSETRQGRGRVRGQFVVYASASASPPSAAASPPSAPPSASSAPSSSIVASWYCWYSDTKSFMLDSASVNSISSMPSPVYQ